MKRKNALKLKRKNALKFKRKSSLRSLQKNKNSRIQEKSMKNAIETKNLVKKYGKLLAVNGLDMNVPLNSIYGFLGRNGAGKTTTLNIISALIRPSSGDVFVLGESVLRNPGKAKQNIGILPQNANFYHNRTAFDHMVFYAKLAGVENPKKEAKELLHKVGLDEKAHVKVGKFSHGMYKLLGLAQAFIGKPKIVLLDEPTSGLDPKIMYQVRKFILSYKGKTTIVLSSHYLDDVSRLCTHIGIIKDGRMVHEAKTKKSQDLEKIFLRYG
jgi:ABC-2 type transport system ATP-binding protein